MSGQDPMADIQDIIGYQGGNAPGVYGGLVGPNPYLDSAFQGKLPFGNSVPGGSPGFGQFYTGVAGNLPPTDAMGNPIQSFVDANNAAQQQYQQQLAAYNAQKQSTPQTPGTSLTSIPDWANQQVGPSSGLGSGMDALALQAANRPGGTNSWTPQYRAQVGQAERNADMMAWGMAGALNGGTPLGTDTGQFHGGGGAGQFSPNIAMMDDQYRRQALQNLPQQAAPSQGTPPTPPNMRQAYLDALANPGPVPTYGAAPPQPGQTLTGSAQQPTVIQSFLAAHPSGGTTGAGGYNNQGFFATLNKLQGGNVT